jgi:PAS domain S-box-containing protein
LPQSSYPRAGRQIAGACAISTAGRPNRLNIFLLQGLLSVKKQACCPSIGREQIHPLPSQAELKTTGLHILQVTDSPADAESICRVLSTDGYEVCSLTTATHDELRASLADSRLELVIAHNGNGALKPGEILPVLHEDARDLPCIVIAEQVGKEAVELLKAGAYDYVLRADLLQLGKAVAAALETHRERMAQRRAEVALRESEDKFSRTFRISPDSINLNRLSDGVYVDINEGFTRILGYTREEVIGRSSMPGDLNVWVRSEDRDRLAAELKAKGEVVGLEAPFRAKDGRTVIGLMSARIFKLNGEPCVLSFTRDITARKHAEAEREATIRLLHLCNQHDNTRRLVRELLHFFQNLTGCEAIGVRLRDGPDFPYFDTIGFPPDFVESECHLCPFDATGELVRDSAGMPALACLCGQILRCRFDTSRPCFTGKGSFWTNCTTDWRADATGSEPTTALRFRCNDEGYESVALIPLRGHNEPIGLLQINGRCKDRFTAAQIELLERLADHASSALIKLDAERARRSSEEHLRAVLDTSEAGYFFIDPQGRFTHVNPAWLRLHGYEREEEVLGKHYRIAQVDADRDKMSAFINELLAGANRSACEFSRRSKDGSVGHQTLSAHVVQEEGRILGLEGFLIDTTRLQQIREEYQMLFEQMLDGFALHEMIFDAAGKPQDYRFLAVNPAFERITGMKAADVIGKRLREVLPTAEPKWVELYGRVVTTGEPRRFEEFSASLGKNFEVLAFRPKEGQFACLIQDVTDRKQLERQLLQAQKMEAIGQLAGGVAHDFNNILSATMMHMSLLMKLPSLSPAMKLSLKELETETKRATGLTRQLLLFSRQQTLQMCSIDLNELLVNLLKMLRRLIGENIQLDFVPGKDPLWIEADPGMIEQVVMNLCVNARDAMPQGGRVVISARVAPLDTEKNLGDAESRSGEFIRLSVADSGCGMDDATLKHIFEPFFTTKDPGKGTGLGLATVYSIVKQHHGWVTVNSAVDKGTDFHVFLPAATELSYTSNNAGDQPAVKGGVEGILVVEDDTGFRNMMVMTLKVLGYQVFEAIDGPSALKVWKKHAAEIAVLFTDQVMPGGISGFELCQRLHQAKPELRRIISTGYAADRVDPTELAAQGIAFLPKPFSSEALASAMRRCLDQPTGISFATSGIRPP